MLHAGIAGGSVSVARADEKSRQRRQIITQLQAASD